ncbi:MAG: hypothetical protein CBD18_09140 [Opitutales bacterium TMED158]|nr:MAG: hypothetical protein CBD18_09140 [Opitutales bacterium TMED158]
MGNFSERRNRNLRHFDSAWNPRSCRPLGSLIEFEDAEAIFGRFSVLDSSRSIVEIPLRQGGSIFGCVFFKIPLACYMARLTFGRL